MDLARQRHGRDRGDRQPAAPRLERPERERQEHRDRAEQMAAGGLDRAVRRQREREPADERRRRGGGGATGATARRPPAPTYVSSANAFHAPTVPNRTCSGPKTSPNGHPAKLTRFGDSGWKLYGSSHGARAHELVSGQPEVVRRLQVVAGRDDAGPGLPYARSSSPSWKSAGERASAPAAR